MNAIQQIQDAQAAKSAALAHLHIELGFESAVALSNAILAAAQGRSASPAAGYSKGPGKKGKRVPEATRKAIAEALRAGETGSALPAKFGVSYNIVHAIKTELGMVRASKRRKRASK